MGLKRAEEALRKFPESSRPAQLGATTLAAHGRIRPGPIDGWIGRSPSIPDDPHIRYNAACMWAQLGELDRAFDYLDEWANHSGTENRDWMLHDPDLDPLRDASALCEAPRGARMPGSPSVPSLRLEHPRSLPDPAAREEAMRLGGRLVHQAGDDHRLALIAGPPARPGPPTALSAATLSSKLLGPKPATSPNSVAVGPGQSALTLTPCRFTSSCSASLNDRTKALVAK